MYTYLVLYTHNPNVISEPRPHGGHMEYRSKTPVTSMEDFTKIQDWIRSNYRRFEPCHTWVTGIFLLRQE